MSYAMRFRANIRVVTTPGTPADTDIVLIAIGDLDTDTVNPITATLNGTTIINTYAAPDSVVLRSVSQALSHIVGTNDRLQRLDLNVRFEVWGKPVGHSNGVGADLTADMKLEKLYVQGDTPSAGLLVAIAIANQKPKNVGTLGRFTPAYAGPEVGVAETTDPAHGGVGGPGNA